MRDNEKHLVDVPLKQLSRVSHLIRNLRRFHVDKESSDTIMKLASWEKLDEAILGVAGDGYYSGIDALMNAFGDLLSEAVWPE